MNKLLQILLLSILVFGCENNSTKQLDEDDKPYTVNYELLYKGDELNSIPKLVIDTSHQDSIKVFNLSFKKSFFDSLIQEASSKELFYKNNHAFYIDTTVEYLSQNDKFIVYNVFLGKDEPNITIRYSPTYGVLVKKAHYEVNYLTIKRESYKNKNLLKSDDFTEIQETLKSFPITNIPNKDSLKMGLKLLGLDTNLVETIINVDSQ